MERSHLLANLSIAADQAGDRWRGDRRARACRRRSARTRGRGSRRRRGSGWARSCRSSPRRPRTCLRGGLSAASVGMRLFTVAQRGGYAPMIGGLGLSAGPGQRGLQAEHRCRQGYLGADADPGRRAERIPSPSVDLPAMTPSPTRAVSSPRVLSDLFWMGRYAERAENMARLLTVTRERYHEFRYRRELAGSECVPVLLAALGEITGTDTGADGDDAEMVAIAPTTLWSLTADRHRPARWRSRSSGSAWPRARCATRCPTTPGWCWPRSSARCCTAGRAAGIADRGRGLSGGRAQPDAGRNAGAVRGGRRVDGAGRRLDDDGHRQAHRARHWG